MGGDNATKDDSITDSVISETVDQILNAREFCADEMEAARETLLEYGYTPSPERLACAFGQANNQWRTYQKQAGVDPKYRR
mgnify:CR=1 FL=1